MSFRQILRKGEAMTVRRLAEESVQPASFAFNEANAAAARKWIEKYPKGRQQSAVIPLMMLAQEQEGWVTRRAIEAIAEMLGMDYIRVLEVATSTLRLTAGPSSVTHGGPGLLCGSRRHGQLGAVNAARRRRPRL